MIPRELQDYQQWVCWKRVNRTQTKLPISPATGRAASCTDPASWGGYRQARAAASRFRLDGIGFVFTIADPYTGVDLDCCRRDNGDLEPWAAALVERLDSYTEWSPSGEGLHILVKASLPEGGGRRTSGIEIYSSGRYFTITGDQLKRTSSAIKNRQAEILDLVAALDKNSQRPLERYSPLCSVARTDEELILRAQRAKNGAKFQRLWAGDTSDYDGDHSRADGALCSLLAYYTDGEQARVDRLFRRSGLYRQKWDRPTAGSTYGSRTIQAVIRRACLGP
jgi:putative DNA primase/helicase